MADFPMNGRGFAPQAGSYQAYQGYQQPQQSAPQSNGNPVRAMAALTGAGLSLALLIGVGVWGYQLIARDVAGVPVVRAVQGEMRIRPEDPGGAQALNQGLSVNEVAAAGGTAGPSERIVLAPEPIDLSSEDTPLIDQLAAAQPRFAPQAEDAGGLGSEQQSAAAEELDPKMASIEALAARIAAGATPLTTQGQVRNEPVRTSVAEVKRDVAPQRVEPLTLSADAVGANVPGISISPRPKLRPEGVRTASLTATAPSGGARDIDPASIPAGTRLVQLGAYESPEVALKEWERFSARFADYMTGKDRVVQRAQSGGRTFYRLRAIGFSDLADARRFCSALTAQNTDCIPVVTR
ncbi:MAG: SPOR domain-containing protein [Planktotalea sp.]|uniref:SPOR domain-containing protein n=1 Tax=Planktotalea sp. TaxID=2029877 RepID=UPI003C761D46